MLHRPMTVSAFGGGGLQISSVSIYMGATSVTMLCQGAVDDRNTDGVSRNAADGGEACLNGCTGSGGSRVFRVHGSG